MKTTIELPDSLFKQAKIESAKKGISLKDLFINALEKELNIENASVFPWKELLSSGSAKGLSSSESGFDEYEESEWIHSIQVNESPLNPES